MQIMTQLLSLSLTLDVTVASPGCVKLQRCSTSPPPPWSVCCVCTGLYHHVCQGWNMHVWMKLPSLLRRCCLAAACSSEDDSTLLWGPSDAASAPLHHPFPQHPTHHPLRLSFCTDLLALLSGACCHRVFHIRQQVVTIQVTLPSCIAPSSLPFCTARLDIWKVPLCPVLLTASRSLTHCLV